MLIALTALFTVLLIALIICFRPLDTTPYQQTDFYKKELEEINKLPKTAISNAADTALLQAGWASVNLLPPFTTPIAIDDHRGGKHFEGVHDSIYVRAFVFKLGERKVAYVSADLLIIPRQVEDAR